MRKKIGYIIIFIGILFIISGVCISLFSTKTQSSNTDNKDVKLENGATINKDGEIEKSSIDSKYYTQNKDGSYVNTSEKVVKKHASGDFYIENMKISVGVDNPEMADYSFTLKNSSTQNYSPLNISIIFILSDGTKFVNPISSIENLAPGESIEIKAQSFVEIIGATDYEFSYK